MKHRIVVFLLLATLMLVRTARSQSFMDSLAREDHEISSSIAPYPADVRAAILDASQYPQVLVKLERLQARTSQSFQDLVSGYSREDQQVLYQASRYPDVVTQLVNAGANASQAGSIVKTVPDEAQKDILAAYNNHYKDLSRMNDLYQSSENSMQKVIAKYPDNVQQSFRRIVSMPDVMTLLTDNIDVTVGLGEAYQADPNGVKQQLDSLHDQLQQQNDKDLAAYKNEVDNDPKLQAEMKKAADEFATQYNQPDNPTYVANNYYDNTPYPYWFGYPYWYTSAMWYPQPLYFQTGFYYGPSGNIIVCGLPSHLYANWFFGFGYTRYPAMYRSYHTYYDMHRMNVRNMNVNVYRGFNTVAHHHFTNINRNPDGYRRADMNPNNNHVMAGRNDNAPAVRNRGRDINTSAPAQHEAPRMRETTAAPQQQHFSAPQRFNSAGFNHFQAQSFHSMGWHGGGGMGGGMGMGGGGGRHR
ncbi:MAG TPA: hypothetical protein VIN08_24565 [Ohtaekwangia sp.]|uniref:hypothetical protein n=1 Tax=Ohtaekwangia sp. TaxID=2066019 RepID=UPI002F9550B8